MFPCEPLSLERIYTPVSEASGRCHSQRSARDRQFRDQWDRSDSESAYEALSRAFHGAPSCSALACPRACQRVESDTGAISDTCIKKLTAEASSASRPSPASASSAAPPDAP